MRVSSFRLSTKDNGRCKNCGTRVHRKGIAIPKHTRQKDGEIFCKGCGDLIGIYADIDDNDPLVDKFSNYNGKLAPNEMFELLKLKGVPNKKPFSFVAKELSTRVEARIIPPDEWNSDAILDKAQGVINAVGECLRFPFHTFALSNTVFTGESFELFSVKSPVADYFIMARMTEDMFIEYETTQGWLNSSRLIKLDKEIEKSIMALDYMILICFTTVAFMNSEREVIEADDVPRDVICQEQRNSTGYRPRYTKVVKVVDLNRHRKSIKHFITCPAWGVRGHYRHYKSGKVVWIEAYKKGKCKDGLETMPRTYKV